MAKKIDRKYLEFKWNVTRSDYSITNIEEHLELIYLGRISSYYDLFYLLVVNKFKLEEKYLRIIGEEIYRKILNDEIDTYEIFDKETELPNLKDLEKVYNIYKLTE
jgi:hypothetical protein